MGGKRASVAAAPAAAAPAAKKAKPAAGATPATPAKAGKGAPARHSCMMSNLGLPGSVRLARGAGPSACDAADYKNQNNLRAGPGTCVRNSVAQGARCPELPVLEAVNPQLQSAACMHTHKASREALPPLAHYAAQMLACIFGKCSRRRPGRRGGGVPEHAAGGAAHQGADYAGRARDCAQPSSQVLRMSLAGAAGGGAGGDAAAYESALREVLRTKGPTTLAALGSAVKKPPSVPKLKKFLEEHAAFHLDAKTQIASLA